MIMGQDSGYAHLGVVFKTLNTLSLGIGGSLSSGSIVM